MGNSYSTEQSTNKLLDKLLRSGGAVEVDEPDPEDAWVLVRTRGGPPSPIEG